MIRIKMNWGSLFRSPDLERKLPNLRDPITSKGLLGERFGYEGLGSC